MGGFLPPSERRGSALMACFAALSLLLLVVGEHLPQAALRGAGAWFFSPFDRVVLTADRMAAAWRENQQLHQRIAELVVENQRLRGALAENRQLRETLGLPRVHGLSFKPVEVLALSGEPLVTAATVSAGDRQGVRVGDAVVTSEGLVGRIGEVYPTLSRAVLLTDPNAAVACEVESTGVFGILRFSATPHPRLTLTSVPLADTIRVGQRVLTSSLSRRYPRGIPVGVVVRVGTDASGLTQDVEVAPAARLSRLRHAFVVPQPGSAESQP